MKLPRWLVFCLLTGSVLFSLSIPVWLWITQPVRTIREFFDLIAEEKLDAATSMIEPSPGKREMVLPGEWRPEFIKPQSRTMSEMLAGRQTIQLASGVKFIVERGTVRGEDFNILGIGPVFTVEGLEHVRRFNGSDQLPIVR